MYRRRNRHALRRIERVPELDLRDLLTLTLHETTILREPLYAFGSIMKRNAAKMILRWYRNIKSQPKIKDFVGR